MLACTDKSVEACGMLLAQTANYSTEDVIMLHTFQERQNYHNLKMEANCNCLAFMYDVKENTSGSNHAIMSPA